MDSVGSSYVHTNYGSYAADYEASSAAVCEASEADASVSFSDSSSIGTFASGDRAELNDLYGQKTQAESELGEITAQKNEAQTKVNARRQELTQDKLGGAISENENNAMGNVLEVYNKTVSDRADAQQELNLARQESSANDQAISSNAQQRQAVSAKLSSAQSQLASLTAPARPSGDDEENGGNYEAEYSAYESQKSALESQIAELQQELQALQSESKQLQDAKTRLDRDLTGKESKLAQLDADLQTIQPSLDEYYQNMAADNAGLENAFADDGELRELQSELQGLQQQEAEKQAEVADIKARITDAESHDEGLQIMREEAADRALREAAAQTGFDAAGAEAAARSAAAQEEYGKPYEELTEEEKLSVEVRVDGEVTLEAMARARDILKEDPDNAAAQAVIERGAKSLDAQTQLAQTRLNNSMEMLPEALREGAAAAMAEARNMAADELDSESSEDADQEAGTVNAEDAAMQAEIAALEALERYIADNEDNAALTPEELAALHGAAGAAADYKTAVTNADNGAAIVDDASESFAESDLAAMKADLAAQLGVSPDQLIVLSGTDGKDYIDIAAGENGGLCVTIGDHVYNYTAEEAKYLIIDGGAGDDSIGVVDYDEDVRMPDLHIFGGSGKDYIEGGNGSDFIFGGTGDDEIYGMGGDDTIFGGTGDDKLYGDDWYFDDNLGDAGNDLIYGGAGNDTIQGGDGNDIISGDEGDDEIYGGWGDDVLYGGGGLNRVYGNIGNYHYSSRGDHDYAFSDNPDVCDGGDYIIGCNVINGKMELNENGEVDCEASPAFKKLCKEMSEAYKNELKRDAEIVKTGVSAGLAARKIYQGFKCFGEVSGMTGVFGAGSVLSGIWEAYKGFESGDGWQIASGGFQTVSGGFAIAAACGAGPWTLIVAGGCMLVHLGIDIFT